MWRRHRNSNAEERRFHGNDDDILPSPRESYDAPEATALRSLPANTPRSSFGAHMTPASTPRSSMAPRSRPATVFVAAEEYADLPPSGADPRDSYMSVQSATDNIYAEAEDLPPGAGYANVSDLAAQSETSRPDNAYGQIQPLPTLAEYTLTEKR